MKLLQSFCVTSSPLDQKTVGPSFTFNCVSIMCVCIFGCDSVYCFSDYANVNCSLLLGLGLRLYWSLDLSDTDWILLRFICVSMLMPSSVSESWGSCSSSGIYCSIASDVIVCVWSVFVRTPVISCRLCCVSSCGSSVTPVFSSTSSCIVFGS